MALDCAGRGFIATGIRLRTKVAIEAAPFAV